MEDTDLLRNNKNKRIFAVEQNGKSLPNGTSVIEGPPDGGARAWSIMIGSFLINGLIFGIINSSGEIYRVLVKQLEQEGVEDAGSKASLVGTLTIGITFFLSPVSGALTNAMGIRVTTMLGGTIVSVGMLISSFVTHDINLLYFSYGVLYGLGASLAYTPSLAILGHYFKRRLGMVNGVVSAGSSVFTVIIPQLMIVLNSKYGLPVTFRVLAAFTFGIALCGILFKPSPIVVVHDINRHNDDLKSVLASVLSIEIWKNSKYVVWALAVPVALFGYFVPYVHLARFIDLNYPGSNKVLPIQCMGGASFLGRLMFGYLSDKPKVDRIFLQQLSFYFIGCFSIILPFIGKYELVVFISFMMGIFDGAFISLLGPVAFDLCGAKLATQAIGCLLGFASFPIVIGPVVAGYLFDLNRSYTLPLLLSGFPPLVGASLMFLIRVVGNKNKGTVKNDDTRTTNILRENEQNKPER